MFLWQATDPPDITGKWYGDGWGEVELEHQSLGQYKGVYSDTFGDQQGTIELKWSRTERRFNGKWGEGKDRFGKLSLRHTDDGIFGAWTTSEKSEINPAHPKLSDLQWSRRQAAKASGFRDPFDGVEKPLEDFHANRQPSNAAAKKPDLQQEAVAASKFSTVWVWDQWPKWKLVFKGGKTWIEGKRSTWTETKRSEECIYLRDDDRNMFGMLYGDSYFYREDPDETWTMVTGSWVSDKAKPVPPKAADFATVWVWDQWPKWKLVFKGGKTWIEGKRSTWTETKRSKECIYLHDADRNMYRDALRQ